MSALSLLALVPLVLSLMLGGPAFANVSPAVPSTSEPAVPALASVDASGDDWAAPLSGSLDQLSVEPLDLPPLALTDPAPSPIPQRESTTSQTKSSQPVVSAPFTSLLSLLKPPKLVNRQGGPPTITADQIITTAESLLRVPYVWGGTTDAGLDCSAFVSRAWGIGRRTTESLPGVAFQINKDELLPGDILNLTIEQDPRGYGHVRLFAGWASSDHSRMWVYEETPPRAIHRVIKYDPRYTPLRRVNYSPGDMAASHLLNMLFGHPDTSIAAPDAATADDSAEVEDDDSPDTTDSPQTPADFSPHGLVGNVLQGHAAPARGFLPLALFNDADTSWDSDTWHPRSSTTGSSRPAEARHPVVASYQPLWQPAPVVSWQPTPSPTATHEHWQWTTSTQHAEAGQDWWEQQHRQPTPQTTPVPQPTWTAPTRTHRTTTDLNAGPSPTTTPRPWSTPAPQATASAAWNPRETSSRASQISPQQPGSSKPSTSSQASPSRTGNSNGAPTHSSSSSERHHRG